MILLAFLDLVIYTGHLSPQENPLASICFGPTHSGKKKFLAKFGFFKKFFSISPLKLVFWTNMESNAAVTLHFEDLAVQNYLFLKDVCIC